MRVQNSLKRSKKQLKPIFATVREESSPTLSQTDSEPCFATSSKSSRWAHKSVASSTLKAGRWTIEEHKRFVDAIIKHGNNWKMVQECIGSRSCSQARSHAQKFFLKLKRSDRPEFQSVAEHDSIVNLQHLMHSLPREAYDVYIEELYNIAQEKSLIPTVKQETRLGDNVSFVGADEL